MQPNDTRDPSAQRALGRKTADRTVRFRDASTFDPVGEGLRHTGPLRSLSFSADGGRLAAAAGGAVQLWTMASGASLGDPIAHTGQVLDAALSPDGHLLAVSEASGLRIWRLDAGSLAHQACRLAGRNLTQAEWDAYVGSDIPYQRTCALWTSGEGAPEDAPVTLEVR